MSTTEPILETATLLEGQLTKEILRLGAGEATPSSGDQVVAHYTGRLAADGSIFDSSISRGQPFKFNIGRGEVVRAGGGCGGRACATRVAPFNTCRTCCTLPSALPTLPTFAQHAPHPASLS